MNLIMKNKANHNSIWFREKSFERKFYNLLRVRKWKKYIPTYSPDIPVLEKASEKIVQPILRVISDYGITGDMQIHYQRLLRSVMHGFFAHENVGGFSVSLADRDES